MKQYIGLWFVAGAVILIMTVLIAIVSPTLPQPLGLAIIVLPEMVAAVATCIVWHGQQDHRLRQDALDAKVDDLTHFVKERMTLLLVTSGDEQRKLGQAEGAASVPPVDAAVVATAAAAAVASVVSSQAAAAADAAVIAKQVIMDAARVAAEVDRQRILAAAAAAKIAANVANGHTEQQLQNIEDNTAATVQAIKDNHA